MSTTQVLSVRGALPPHRHSQGEITDAFAEVIARGRVDERVLRRLHANAGVRTRHTVLALERYATLTDFGAANDEFITAAVALGSQAVQEATVAAGVDLADIDVVIANSRGPRSPRDLDAPRAGSGPSTLG